MEIQLCFSIAVISIAFYTFAHRLLRRFKNLPPSPFPSLPFIGHLYLLEKPFHKSLKNLSTKYGPVINLNLGCVPIVLVSSPSTVEECLSKNDIIFANRPKFLLGKYFGYNYTSMPWSSYGDHWRNLRKISSLEVLSSKKLEMLSGVRIDEVRTLTRKILEISKKSDVVDMKSACFELTFNILTRIITGKRYYGENIENSKEAKTFHDMVREISEINPKANVLDFLPFMRWVGGLKHVEKRMKDVQEIRDRFMQNIIEEHREDDGGGGGVKTMIGTLLGLQKTDPSYYTDELIRNLMLVLLQAGSDTTAITMEWAFTHLLNNPEILNKAQIEIDNHVGNERLTDESDLSELPYIRCIINETLRMHPVGPLLMPHKSNKDCSVGGFYIPQGTILFVNAWDIQQNPKYWESSPEKFIPERFECLGGCKEDDFKFIPFGIGRRGCPGNNLAVQILGLALGSLIQCFNWEKVGDNIDMTETIAVPPSKAQPLLAKCQPRPSILSLL